MALSKEQRRAKKEAIKQQKLKAQLEIKKRLKRGELNREIRAQALKRQQIDNAFREMMLTIKEPVFKKDIQIMWHTFERVLDKKDNLMNYTIKLISVADDQFQRTVASFCDILDGMITKFLEDLEYMSNENDRKTAEVLKSGEDEASKIMTDHGVAETHLQLMIHHGHTTADNAAWTTRGENLVKEDEDRKKYSNERDNLRSYLENVYNNTWDDYKAVLKSYVVGTAENQKEVRKLRRKENVMADIIASQAKKIANNDDLLKRLRLDLASYESGTKQAVFRDRRDRYRVACFRLKKELTDGCANDEAQLATLVKASNDAIEWIEAAHKKAEKILRLAALCRKFETRREKILPYGTNKPFSPNTKQNIRRNPSDDSLVINAISSTSGLTRLWQRVANAELTRRALLREKTKLIDANTHLEDQITEFKMSEMDPGSEKCICITSPNPSVA